MYRLPQETQTKALVQDIGRLTVNDTRYVHRLLRRSSVAVNEHTFLPRLGMTLGEVCTVLNLKKVGVKPLQRHG